jgi:hypothetical protein
MKLNEKGTDKVYAIPCDTAKAFFLACGYEETEEYCDDLDAPVFTKLSTKNTCHNK